MEEEDGCFGWCYGWGDDVEDCGWDVGNVLCCYYDVVERWYVFFRYVGDFVEDVSRTETFDALAVLYRVYAEAVLLYHIVV